MTSPSGIIPFLIAPNQLNFIINDNDIPSNVYLYLTPIPNAPSLKIILSKHKLPRIYEGRQGSLEKVEGVAKLKMYILYV